MAKKQSGLAPDYLHGFTSDEQDRLYKQARFLEPYVFAPVDFSQSDRVIEIGCGVGAQSEILLRRHPNLKIDGVDASEKQLSRAKKHLSKQIQQQKIKLHKADALHLPFKDDTFDGAFICWFLEHVTKPIEILKEAKRVLKKNAFIHCHEVVHSSFFVHPYSPATLQYWFEYNDHQWNLKGDPFVGAKLGNYLQAAGYQNIQTQMINHHYDNRTPKQRALFIDDFIELLLSGAPALLKAKKVTPALVKTMKLELEKLKHDDNSVIIYSWVYAKGQAL